MIDVDNQTDLKIELDRLEKIADALTNADVELVITDDEVMQNLNSEHRRESSSTDVLSFPLETPFTEQSVFGMPLGSIVISKGHVLNKSEELGHTPQDELSLLFIHGMLHLLGFDHETDHGEMRLREKELITKFGLPQSLIVRTEEH